METVSQKLGGIGFTLTLECFLRQKERERLPEAEYQKLEAVFQKYRSVGFNTFGEQFGGAHINQTLSGVAFGKAA